MRFQCLSVSWAMSSAWNCPHRSFRAPPWPLSFPIHFTLWLHPNPPHHTRVRAALADSQLALGPSQLQPFLARGSFPKPDVWLTSAQTPPELALLCSEWHTQNPKFHWWLYLLRAETNTTRTGLQLLKEPNKCCNEKHHSQQCQCILCFLRCPPLGLPLQPLMSNEIYVTMWAECTGTSLALLWHTQTINSKYSSPHVS